MAKQGKPEPRGTSWRTVVLVIAVVLVIVFIAVNSTTVTVDFVFFDASMPLVFALLIAAVLGLVIGLILPRLRAGRS